MIFGATGDLAQRMLLPALFGLHRDGLLPKDIRLLATARSAMDQEGFRKVVADAVERRVPRGEQRPSQLASLLRSGRASYRIPAVVEERLRKFPGAELR